MLEFSNVSRVYNSGIFGTKKHLAVDDVSFTIAENETFGLIGESGCGKSTVAKMCTRLINASSGMISLDGKDIKKLSLAEKLNFTKKVQMIFQAPQSSFNPKMKLYDIIAEPLRIHKIVSRDEERDFILENCEKVGLTSDIFHRYAHEISGGQCQRVAIMRILMIKPKIIIADEPTSQLDVSVQAQILYLIKEVLESTGSSMVFISHDLEVVRAMCKRIAVMKQGKIVEQGDCETVFTNPQDEYSKFLINNIR